MDATLLAAMDRFVASMEAWEAAQVTAQDQSAYADVSNTLDDRLRALLLLTATVPMERRFVALGHDLAPLLVGDAAALLVEYLLHLPPAAIDHKAAGRL